MQDTEDRHLRQLKHNRTGKTLKTIIEEECRRSGINPQEQQGGGKRRAVSGTRSIIAKRGREELGLSAAAIARRAGVSTSAITKAIESMEKDPES